MRRLVLALPVLFLALSFDRILPEGRLPPADAVVATWNDACASYPRRNEGRLGNPGDPLNVAFVGTPEAVRAALTGAGWTEIPTALRGSLFAAAGEFFTGRTVAAFPPMNDYRLHGRIQTMNWALPVRFLQERHHFRLWRTGLVDARGRDYWWGSANYDLRVRWHDLSHVPDPNNDMERDFIVSTLARSPRLNAAALLPVERVPLEGFNDKGYPFRTDGRVAVFDLK